MGFLQKGSDNYGIGVRATLKSAWKNLGQL